MKHRALQAPKTLVLALALIAAVTGAPTRLCSDVAPDVGPSGTSLQAARETTGVAPQAKKYDRASIDNGFTSVNLKALPPLVVVTANVNGMPMAIGEITASVTPVPGHTMTGTFTPYPMFAALCACIEFHWVQIITADACPATIAGAVPAFPHLDPPAYGWDYMYADQDMPANGIQADERNPGGMAPMASSPGFADDIVDTLPWYHTTPEETASFVICSSYPIDDTPSFCPMAGVTGFRTYLVARPIGQATFCLLAGFGWTISSAGNTGPTAIPAPDAGQAMGVQAALANGNIPGGWTATANCNITCAALAVEGTTWGRVKALYRDSNK